MELKKLITTLKQRKKTIALAESCSGGYASYLLTKIPGASAVFKGAIVTYSLEAKNKFFKVPAALLKKTQGVSKEVALKLATGARKKFNADIGASIVGFAGPSTTLRASKKEKTGTIFIAFSSKEKEQVKKVIIKGGRDTIRKKASTRLIELIHKSITTQSLHPGGARI